MEAGSVNSSSLLRRHLCKSKKIIRTPCCNNNKGKKKATARNRNNPARCFPIGKKRPYKRKWIVKRPEKKKKIMFRLLTKPSIQKTIPSRIQGPDGQQGLQGNQGAQGLQGNRGNLGNQGAQGLQGNRGSQGLPGSALGASIQIIPDVQRYFTIAHSDIQMTITNTFNANLFVNDAGQVTDHFAEHGPNGYFNLYINAVMQEGSLYKVNAEALTIYATGQIIKAGTPIIVESIGFTATIIQQS
jgi:hypothetical protein